MEQDLEIKKYLAEQLAAGVSLSEAQNLINQRFQRKLTFMEVRVLASELDNIDWSAHDPAPPAPEPEAAGKDEVLEPENLGSGKTLIEESKVLRPGAIAGGSVRFSSGATAEWYVDQFGRLGLDKPSGEPTDEDLRDFQLELEKMFARR